VRSGKEHRGTAVPYGHGYATVTCRFSARLPTDGEAPGGRTGRRVSSPPRPPHAFAGPQPTTTSTPLSSGSQFALGTERSRHLRRTCLSANTRPVASRSPVVDHHRTLDRASAPQADLTNRGNAGRVLAGDGKFCAAATDVVSTARLSPPEHECQASSFAGPEPLTGSWFCDHRAKPTSQHRDNAGCFKVTSGDTCAHGP